VPVESTRQKLLMVTPDGRVITVRYKCYWLVYRYIVLISEVTLYTTKAQLYDIDDLYMNRIADLIS